MTVQFRFEKKLKNRERITHGTKDSNDERMYGVWRSILSFEIFASWFDFSGKGCSSLPAQWFLFPLCENMSGTDSSLIKPSNQQQRNPGNCHQHKPSLSFLQLVSKMIKTQILGLTRDFRTNGLPWSGHECRSIIAGGSGVLYCLPALFCKDNNIEQYRWITQALLSIMADYVYIDRNSWIHGIDRIFATTNTIAVIFRAVSQLQIIIVVLSIIPISAFILANRSKKQLNLQWWKYYHFIWHLAGSLSVTFVVYLLYNCPDYAEDVSTDDFVLNQFCAKAS